ncbi:MAG: Uncharacterised protein [Hyphomonas sp. TMED17]|nr:MAG: Uncharacterised protein [Hyphomonas sp. TMED17]
MIDMPHNRNNRWSSDKLSRIILDAVKTNLDVRFGDAVNRVSEFGCNQFGRICVNDIISPHHLALRHDEFHDIRDALIHPAGQILQRDCFGQRDFN